MNLNCNKNINDFGNGFYCGENLEQSAMFVSTYPHSTLYILKANFENLTKKEFTVNQEWMLTIAYFRNRLKEFQEQSIVRKLSKIKDNIDYIVAPIADNKMFEIIDSFISGEITDVQCQHCLSATNLGLQYIFVSQKALSQIQILECCYLPAIEKATYLKSRIDSFQINLDKVKLARKQYRTQGQYIEDILK